LSWLTLKSLSLTLYFTRHLLIWCATMCHFCFNILVLKFIEKISVFLRYLNLVPSNKIVRKLKEKNWNVWEYFSLKATPNYGNWKGISFEKQKLPKLEGWKKKLLEIFYSSGFNFRSSNSKGHSGNLLLLTLPYNKLNLT